jgi:hypothetical protein
MPIDKNSPKYKEYMAEFVLIAEARKKMVASGKLLGTRQEIFQRMHQQRTCIPEETYLL